MPAVTVEDILAVPRVAVPAGTAQATPGPVDDNRAPASRARVSRCAARSRASTSELDPFIHMDQMGEVEYAPGEPKGTPWHPHRGFETVTYMIDGMFEHQDSNGGGGVITNGDTQWMTAGGGILHIETPPEPLVLSGGLFHGIQLWVNLPGTSWPPRAIRTSGPRGLAADLGRRRRTDPGDRGRPRRPRRPRLHLHPDQPGARDRAARRKADLPGAGFNALAYVLAGSGTVGPDHRPVNTGQSRCSARRRNDRGRGPHQERTPPGVVVLGGQPIRDRSP